MSVSVNMWRALWLKCKKRLLFLAFKGLHLFDSALDVLINHVIEQKSIHWPQHKKPRL